jgi:uncharacterized protein (TIGR03083 family)
MDETVAAFASAADFLVAVVDRIGASDWGRPGLGSWDVRELVAHANRGMTTVEQYLTDPMDPASVQADYATPESVAARARASVAALGDDPSATVRQTRDRVVPLIARTPMDAVIGTPFGHRSLGAYLPSRTAELTIHGIDIADALGLSVEVPSDALAETLRGVANMAVTRGHGPELLRALSGRATLPPGFSVF